MNCGIHGIMWYFGYFVIPDFETVCEQSLPYPWEEEHGIYAIMVSCVI